MEYWKRAGLWIAVMGMLGGLVLAGSLRGVAAAPENSGKAAGGLETAPIGPTLSKNLLVNGDFSQGMTGWHASTSCFVLDPSTRTPAGKPSLKIDNDQKCGIYSKVAANEFAPPPGTYSVEGEIKTDHLNLKPGGARPVGARIDLFRACATKTIEGTTGWGKVSCHPGLIAPDSKSAYRLEIYNQPSGTAWFGDLSLRREVPPAVQTFLLYPNYRGYLFPDEPQEARFAVNLNPEAAGLHRADAVFQIEAEPADGGAGKPIRRDYAAPADEFTAVLGLSGAPAGAYHVRGKLLDKSGEVFFIQSPYRVVKIAANPQAALKAWIDDRNLAHFGDGKPHYVIGIYDTSGYSPDPNYYAQQAGEVAQAPVNLLINYMITNAPVAAIDAYTDALTAHGIFFMPTVNDFYAGGQNYPKALAAQLGAANQDALIAKYAAALAENRAVVGYYVQDEAMPEKAPETFHQYKILRANDPAGFTMAVIRPPTAAEFWKDAVDVIGVDPYPINEPSGNVLSDAGDWTRQAIAAVHGARPVWTVIQFFQQTSISAWPTQQQLHDMTWMAIAEGASGVFYWSHGARGLAWVKDPAKKAALWKELIAVTKEVKEMEPVLLRPDAPVLAEKPAGDFVTKEKTAADGTRYVIAYNHAGEEASAKFVMASPAHSVKIMWQAKKAALENGTAFADSFAPYEAKVYKIR